MNTKQKLTFLAALVLASGAAYAAMVSQVKAAPSPVAKKEMVKPQQISPEVSKAKADSDYRLKKMVEYRGGTPLVADFCFTNPEWPDMGDENELTCHFTGFRNHVEIYTAGWRVVSVKHGKVPVPGVVGEDLIYIERIGTEQWKGQQIGFK